MLTRGEPGELSDPVIHWTKPSSPGSGPRNVQIIPTNNTAAVKWAPPTVPNGKISFYRVITTQICFFFKSDKLILIIVQVLDKV